MDTQSLWDNLRLLEQHECEVEGQIQTMFTYLQHLRQHAQVVRSMVLQSQNPQSQNPEAVSTENHRQDRPVIRTLNLRNRHHSQSPRGVTGPLPSPTTTTPRLPIPTPVNPSTTSVISSPLGPRRLSFESPLNFSFPQFQSDAVLETPSSTTSFSFDVNQYLRDVGSDNRIDGYPVSTPNPIPTSAPNMEIDEEKETVEHEQGQEQGQQQGQQQGQEQVIDVGEVFLPHYSLSRTPPPPQENDVQPNLYSAEPLFRRRRRLGGLGLTNRQNRYRTRRNGIIHNSHSNAHSTTSTRTHTTNSVYGSFYQPNNYIGTSRASIIDLLPQWSLTKKPDHRCGICLSPYNEGENVRTLRCFHYFHVNCIDPWLETSDNCPNCRISTFESSGGHQGHQPLPLPTSVEI
jgi:hypothetical protein